MLVIKKGRNQEEVKNRKVEGAVVSFLEKKAEIDKLTAELRLSKQIIIDFASEELDGDDASTITFGVDDDAVKVSFGFDVKVVDDIKLKEILGDRFDDLVTTRTEFKPDNKLKIMALEDDGLKTCLAIKEKTPTVAVSK